MSAPTITSMPSTVRAGETIQYTRSLQNYPATEGWTLAVSLRGISVADATVTTNANGRDFDVVIPASVTGPLAAGTYQWLERVTKAPEVHDAGNGVILVLQNLQSATAGQAQTTNEKLLAAVEAKLDGRLTEDMESFVIAGRSIARIPWEDLLSIRERLRWAVWGERNPDQAGRTVQISFPGPELRP